jgi:hypothetical protein
MRQKSPFPTEVFFRQAGWVLLIIIIMFQIPQNSFSHHHHVWLGVAFKPHCHE